MSHRTDHSTRLGYLIRPIRLSFIHPTQLYRHGSTRPTGSKVNLNCIIHSTRSVLKLSKVIISYFHLHNLKLEYSNHFWLTFTLSLTFSYKLTQHLLIESKELHSVNFNFVTLLFHIFKYIYKTSFGYIYYLFIY